MNVAFYPLLPTLDASLFLEPKDWSIQKNLIDDLQWLPMSREITFLLPKVFQYSFLYNIRISPTEEFAFLLPIL